MSMFVNNNFFMDSFHWSLKNGPEVHQQDFQLWNQQDTSFVIWQSLKDLSEFIIIFKVAVIKARGHNYVIFHRQLKLTQLQVLEIKYTQRELLNLTDSHYFLPEQLKKLINEVEIKVFILS